MRKFPLALAGIAIILAILACNLPSNNSNQQTPDAIMTAAALTVQAQLPATVPPAPVTAPPAQPPTATFTSVPIPTLPPSATPTSNCNAMQFVADVTIPDGTIMTPGQNFTKTWRLKNVGTCTWTTSYAIVFSSGNSMNGPATQALTGNVNPGQTVDISANLTAPGSNGDYTGYWKLRDGSGVLFNQFYVQIKVQSPPTATNTLPPAIAQAALTSVGSEDGYVDSSGVVNPNPNVGDDSSNKTLEAFLSFDMSAIPSGAVITKVVVDFSSYDTLGNPFTISDGCLRAYVQNYGALDAGDFFPGDPTGAVIRWCGAGELSAATDTPDMISVVQSKVGSSRLQLRLQFRTPTTNGNGVADVVRFGNVKLTVTYH